MQKKMWYKIVSLISVLAMLLSCFSGAVVLADDTAANMPDLKALFEEVIAVSNDTTEDDIADAAGLVDDKLAESASDYVIGELKSFYKMDAIGGAYEIGSANGGSSYTGAPVNDEVLVEGVDGYISFVIGLEDGNEEKDVVVTLKIEAPMEGYSFKTCSNNISDWSGDNTNGYTYAATSGEAEKVVIPDQITKLKNNWNGYKKKIKCIVYGSGTTTTGQSAWTNYALEVVVMNDNITTVSGNSFIRANNLKYVRVSKSLTTINKQGFAACSSLKGLYLPYGVKTINAAMLADQTVNNTQSHNMTKLTIPASVTSIAANAFSGANNPFEITVLGDTKGISATAFYNADYAETYPDTSNYQNNIVRVWENYDSVNSVTTAEGNKKYIAMDIAEATARVAYEAGVAGSGLYPNADYAKADAEKILEAAKKAYGAADYTLAWATDEWNTGLSSVSNVLVLSDGTNTSYIDVELSFVAEKFDGEITVSDTTTENTLKAQLEAATGGKVEITDFYKIKSSAEVVEVNSTYPGAINGEILVPGSYGYVSAYYNVTNDNGEVTADSLFLRIEPEIVEKTYTTISNSISDWKEKTSGKWQYKGPSVDKLVVPDSITGMYANNWWDGSQDFKCVVYGSGYIATGQASWTNKSLEVVVMNDNITTMSGNAYLRASKLKYIKFSKSLTAINAKAFAGCTSLESINIPYGVTTINSNLFADQNDSSVPAHNLTQITIPASVTTINANAFNGANNPCEITILGTPKTVNANAFYNATYASTGNYQNNNVRIWESIDSKVTTVSADNKTYLDDTMGIAEVRARAQQAADRYANNTYDSADAVAADASKILTQIAKAHNYPTATTVWKNSDWSADKGFLFSNTAVITADGKTIEIPFSVRKSGDFDLQAVAVQSGIVIDNDTTKEVLAQKLADIGLNGYTIEILDFYKVNAIDGAYEKGSANGGSSYEGAPVNDEILVPGYDGSLAAIVKVTGNNGESVTSNLLFEIEANMEAYSFATVSNDASHWTTNSSGKIVYSGPSVDKLVIPDSIDSTKLNSSSKWWNGSQKFKCLVYGAGCTTTGKATWGSNPVEVIVMHDNITQTSGNTYMGATTLKYVRLSNNLAKINAQAFAGCSSLKGIYIPDSVTTIGSNIFADQSQKSEGLKVHNLTQITIPASVTSIGANAFSGAANPFEIILLGKTTSLNATAFYNETYASTGNYQNSIVRVYKDSTVDSKIVTAEGCKLYIDDMSVCEAAARTALFAKDLATETFIGADKLEARIDNAILNSTGITYDWANTDWEEKGENVLNVLTLSDGTNTFDIDVTLLAPAGFYADGAEILNTAEWSANNHKQGIRFFSSYRSSATDKIVIDDVEYTIKDFGILIKHIANDSATAGASVMDDATFVIGTDGVIKESGIKGTVTRNDELNKNQFSVYVKNIPQGGRDYWFQSRGYIVYEAADGTEVTIYTDSQFTSAKAEYDLVSADADYAGMTDWFSNKIG